MEMKAQATIRGAKMFNGKMDDGKLIDSGTVFVEVHLKESENAFGMCTEAIRCKDSSVVVGIKDQRFPFIAELTMVSESTGKGAGMQQKIVAIKPVPPAAASRTAPAAG